MIRTGLGHVYRNLEQYFCAFLMVLMVSCLGAQVFFRFVLNASLTWSEELSRFAFIWLVYMGAVLGAKERIHIRVTAFHRLLPAAARGWVLPAADLLWVAINLTFAWQGALQVGHLHALQLHLAGPAMEHGPHLPRWCRSASLLMSFRILEGYWRDWRRGTLGRPVARCRPSRAQAGPASAGRMKADGDERPDTEGRAMTLALLLGTLADLPRHRGAGLHGPRHRDGRRPHRVRRADAHPGADPLSREWTSSRSSRSPASSSPAL